MPNPTQADVVGSAALRVGGMGTLGRRRERKFVRAGQGSGWVL